MAVIYEDNAIRQFACFPTCRVGILRILGLHR
jgi:hypothetical protein